MCTWKHCEGPKIVLKDCIHRGEEWQYSSVEEVFSSMGARQHRCRYLYIYTYIHRIYECALLSLVTRDRSWQHTVDQMHPFSRNKVIIYDNIHTLDAYGVFLIYTRMCRLFTRPNTFRKRFLLLLNLI